MAQGDVYHQGVTSVPRFSFFNMQPPTGTEVVIHNIGHSGDAELQFFDGTSFVTVATQFNGGGFTGVFLHCTNTKYYRLKNINSVEAGASNCFCDGIHTK